MVPADILEDTLRAALERLPSLGRDQVEMAARLASSCAGVECVEAAPGTGKTTALGVYVAACRRVGIPVVGCAPSARARDELRLGARIEHCHTVDRLLLDLDRSPLQPGSTVVLDEASLCGSRKLAELLDHAAASRSKVVLVGDTKQLSSVDAGGGFRGLVARLGAHRLLENRRQVEQWEREALRDLREDRVRPALTAYAAHGRLHIGEREELIQRMVDDWWTARAHGEAAMQASSWRDVSELNERARVRLVEAGLVEREGLDVRGVAVGVGDQVMVLRNAYALGVINGTLGVVTAIDRDQGDIVLQTVEAEPREVRLPASFWNAKGRRRLALAYCRTIIKSQGATYRGESFTLAGDDTINLEAVHVAMSRATKANTLYYVGEPPPHEDHDAAEVAEPEFEGLVAAAGRSRAQVMALDQVDGSTAEPGDGGGSAAHWTEAPMTEAQVTTLARRGVVPGRDLTWVQASLLIDQVAGTPRGSRATVWLHENGASADEAARVIERAERELREPPCGRPAHALDVRLEVLDGAVRDGRRHPTAGVRQERDALQRWQAGAIRDRLRRRREEWARRAPAGDNSSLATARRWGSNRPPPRIAR